MIGCRNDAGSVAGERGVFWLPNLGRRGEFPSFRDESRFMTLKRDGKSQAALVLRA